MRSLFEDEATVDWRSAEISPCGKYRYSLKRRWHAAQPSVNFVMLNPSTADATIDDPTVRKCIVYAKAWGYGGIVVTNLFALRATDPRELKRTPFPVGERNNDHLYTEALNAGLVVCAWGNHGDYQFRCDDVGTMLHRHGVVPHALRVTKKGQPEHPLYLPGDLKPQPYQQLLEALP